MKDFSLPGGVASRRMTDPCGMLVGKAVRGKYVPRALIRPCCQRTHRGQIRVLSITEYDRVLGFFSSRPNWDTPTPLPAGGCLPSPLVPGEVHTCLRERGCAGDTNSDEGSDTVLRGI
jgi:hypothetical protein